MTRPDLDAIEARAAAATPEPWSSQAYGGEEQGDSCVLAGERGTPRSFVAVDVSEVDADFIAAARSDIPALIARVRELERLLAVLVIREGGEIDLDAEDMARIPTATLEIEAPHKLRADRVLSVRVPKETT